MALKIALKFPNY